VAGTLQLTGDSSFDNLGDFSADDATVILSGGSDIENHRAMRLTNATSPSQATASLTTTLSRMQVRQAYCI
jgi:hypothetical protein